MTTSRMNTEHFIIHNSHLVTIISYHDIPNCGLPRPFQLDLVLQYQPSKLVQERCPLEIETPYIVQ